MTISEFVYTVIFKPPFIKKMVNKIIRAIVPKSVRIGRAVVCLNPQDAVVSGALALGVFERQELKLVSNVFHEGMNVVDVGANVGVYTAIAMHRIKKRGRIIAFEPHPESRDYLMQTVAENFDLLPADERPEVDILDMAASASDGEAKLFCNSENKGDNRLYSSELTPEATALSIRARRIDSVLREHKMTAIDFLKVDVQGYEFEVIQGAREILRNSADVVILSEFWPDGIQRASHCDSHEYLTFLADLGFHIYQLDAGKLRPLRGSSDFRSLIGALKGRQYTNIVGMKRLLVQDQDLAVSFPAIKSRPRTATL
ncbi:MAG TPA: FkbM family methyltransferase [Pseudolabrys sp.]